MKTFSRSATTLAINLTTVLFGVVFVLGTPISAQAAVPASDDISVIRAPLLKDIDAPQFGPYRMIGGIKSLQTSARGEEFNNDAGRRFRLFTEYYVGAVHSSGWGLSAMAVTSGTSYANDAKTHYGASDPSITLAHPALYEDSRFKVTGQLREYLAVSDWAVSRQQHHTAYYLITTYQLGNGFALFNSAIPRYFLQPSYKDSDTIIQVEDFTTFSKTINRQLRVGLGAHSFYETHGKIDDGASCEIYPYASLIFSKNFFIEPRFYVPIYKKGETYDSPRSVAINNYQAELFAMVSL